MIEDNLDIKYENFVDYILSVKKFTIDNELNGVKVFIDKIILPQLVIKHEKIKKAIAYVPSPLLQDDANEILITSAFQYDKLYYWKRKLTIVLGHPMNSLSYSHVHSQFIINGKLTTTTEYDGG